MTDTIVPRPKTIENLQWGRTANSFGVNETPAETKNEGQAPLVDEQGRVIVRISGADGYVGGERGYFSSGGTKFPFALSNAAYVKQMSLILSVVGDNIQHTLYDLIGHNHHPTDDLYLQMFLGINGPLVGGEACQIVVPVPGDDVNFSWASNVVFRDVITFALSTTPLVYTDPGAPYLFLYGHAF